MLGITFIQSNYLEVNPQISAHIFLDMTLSHELLCTWCQEMSFPESVERVAGALGSSPRVECTIKFLYLLIISFLLILIFKILKIVKANEMNFNIHSKYLLIKYKLNRSYQPINFD